jgi:hypothetical protein
MIIFEFVHGTYLLNSDLFVKLGQFQVYSFVEDPFDVFVDGYPQSATYLLTFSDLLARFVERANLGDVGVVPTFM